MNECSNSYGEFARIKPNTPKSTVSQRLCAIIFCIFQMVKKDKERAFRDELDDLIKKFREVSSEVMQKQ